MSHGFIKLYREKALELLVTDPNAFLLLTLIVLRARRADASYGNLKANQALIGDWEKIGLSRQEYRSAQIRLEEYNLVSFERTRRGTIATLISTEIFDINADTLHSKQPSNFSIEKRANQPSKNHLITGCVEKFSYRG